MAINLDHVTEQITVTDTAANASLTVNTKGTGAFNIAAGSSGVNISNGGTVTAITTTANGSYTSAPSIAVSAPTTAGGVQSVIAVTTMTPTGTIAISSGGTGYTVGDVLTVLGGTLSSGTTQITVLTVSAGVITAATVSSFGVYSVLPSNPASVTGGTGSGATFTINYRLFGALSITTAGSGYVEQPTVTFSGGGGSGAAAYATVGSSTVQKTLGNIHTFSTPNSQVLALVDKNASGNYPTNTTPAFAMVPPQSAFGAAYFGASNPIYFASSSTAASAFQFATGVSTPVTNGAGGSTQLQVAHTTSAVNYHQLTGSATGSGPVHSVAGSDTNINLNLTPKGSGTVLANGPFTATGSVTLSSGSFNYIEASGAGSGGSPYFYATGGGQAGLDFYTNGTSGFKFRTNNGTNEQLRVSHTASAVNYVQVTGAATGGGVAISAQGSDTNIPLVLQPKGTGALQAQQTDSTATGGNARGANAVDWQTTRAGAGNVASGAQSVLSGGSGNTVSGFNATLSGGFQNNAPGTFAYLGGGSNNQASGQYGNVLGGNSNTASGQNSSITGGQFNTVAGFYNFIGGGFTNSGTSGSAVTTQSGTMNGTTAVTLSGSNANIKVGQYITGTSIGNDTYVAAISGTALTLSKVASGSSTSTLSFFTPHGVVVGGGNNQATGSYSFIGGGGDAGTAGGRNTASGAWSSVVGGTRNTASGAGSFIGGGGTDGSGFYANTASGASAGIVAGINNTASSSNTFVGAGNANVSSGFGSVIIGGYANTANGAYSFISCGVRGTTRSIDGYHSFPASNNPIADVNGVSQAALLVLGAQTTDATATVLRSNTAAAGTQNQVILPNNSAYYFRGEVVSGVTGGGNTKGFFIEGVIKRGANAASTALVGTATVTSNYADAGASAWTIAVTADTTNGGLAVTFTGQAGTTIRTVCRINTVEMTF